MVQAATDHRERLLAGLTESLANKPYREVTLSDITAAARVSRRTFYQHFANQDDCLLALTADTSTKMMHTLLSAVQQAADWSTTVQQVTHAYLNVIQAQPTLMKALYIETATLGLEGLQARRRIAETFAAFLQQQVEHRRQQGEKIRPINQACAVAIVAGINELILHYLIDDKASTLLELAPITCDIINRFVAPESCD